MTEQPRTHEVIPEQEARRFGETLLTALLVKGLKSVAFIDAGLRVTGMGEHGIKRVESPNKGQAYRVMDIQDRAAFNPNQIRTTLQIIYESGQRVETYLDERFDDRVASYELSQEILGPR